MSELRTLSEFLTGVKSENVPVDVKEAATLHVLDTIGTAIGAGTDVQVRSVSEMWKQLDGDGTTHVWGTGEAVPFGTGVFLNAMMGHTQEMDDVHTTSKTHIGTVVIPAAWAAAEYLGCTGQEFLLAVICGYETMSRIGMAFGVSTHRNMGWHVTATAGTFGAAAAVGKLLNLNTEQMICALGLAGAQSFGTWAFLGDGATCKVLNPARAAQSGAEAAFLAKAGMTGPEHILTANDGGLMNCMTSQAQMKMITDGLGTIWQTLYVDNKPYPSCRSTHCTIDAALEIRRDSRFNPNEVDHIEVETYLVGYKQCGLSEGSIHPITPVNAKFSSPFTVACALLYGEMTQKQLLPEVIGKPEVQALLHKVKIVPCDEFTRVYPAHWGCRVKVLMDNGDRIECCVRDASGSVDKPLSKQQVKDKAVSLMQAILLERAEETAEKILNICRCSKMPILK